MAKAPAASLTAGILVKKGAAGASPGAPQRGAEPVATSTMKTAHNAASENLVPLNFRVPESFRKEFADYAYHSDRKMVDLLKASFLALKREEGRG